MKYQTGSLYGLGLPSQIAQLALENAPLTRMLESWLVDQEGDTTRSISFVNGVDEPNSLRINSVCLHFAERREARGALFIDLKDLKAEYKRLEKLPWTWGKDSQSQNITAEAWYERQETACGAQFDAELYHPVAPRGGAIRFALSHAITLGGSCSFSTLCESTKGDLFDEHYDSIASRFQNIVSANFRYFDLESNFGWNGDFYTDIACDTLNLISRPQPQFQRGKIMLEDFNPFFHVTIHECSLR